MGGDENRLHSSWVYQTERELMNCCAVSLSETGILADQEGDFVNLGVYRIPVPCLRVMCVL